MLLQELSEKQLIHPPEWLADNTQYLTQMGSIAYGTNIDTSDIDLYGFCIPSKFLIFPHLTGAIPDFGNKPSSFNQWQEHHVEDKESRKQYDFTVFGIVRYFHLAMENNPNVLDSLFVPQNCIIHCTHVGNLIRENRKMFLHKGCWPKLKGYAYSQLHKAATKAPDAGTKRGAVREKYGMDVKFLCHTVRLLYEAEMILSEGDLDLQRNREHLKSIRRGEISEEEIRQWAADKEKSLERLYENSTLSWGPPVAQIKQLLLSCLEHHYGSLEKMGVVNPEASVVALREFVALADKHRSLLEQPQG